MLKLRDLFHLPQVDDLVKKLVTDEPGVILLAGIDARRPANPSGDVFKPSGLSALFNILMQEILLANPEEQAVIIAQDKALSRVPRAIKRRTRFIRAEPPFSYHGQIELAIVDRPGLLVIDNLNDDALLAAFRAAQNGIRVLTQTDTVLRGATVARQLVDRGLSQELLPALRWVVCSHRMAVLCKRCKKPASESAEMLERFRSRYPELNTALDRLLANQKFTGDSSAPAFYQAGGCEECRGTGYSGDVSVFDLFRGDPQANNVYAQQAQLSMEEYALHLAAAGDVDLFDLLNLESDYLRRTYQMLDASEQALSEANAKLNRKLIELEASNRVLLQRTEVLMSLQDLGQALITSADLHELAEKVCRRAGELCGADRVVLYLRGNMEDHQQEAEILAERGWGAGLVGQRIEAKVVFGQPLHGKPQMQPVRYVQAPPGFVVPERQGQGGSIIKTGLRVPLVVQDVLVGVMIVQSTQKDFFNQGESALLQTFANQAGLAIQRAGLIDELRAKIVQLEAAHEALVKQERLERELELARQVQQSMLPHSFPPVRGYTIAAHNEPARQVGGDLYDMIVLDDDHFAIVVADVADKGMPAALYMSLTRSLLLAEARRTLSPRDTLTNVNRLLLELGEMNGFVSVIYGVVECSSRKFTYARAGHERPILLRNGVVETLDGEGTVLGVVDEANLRLSEEQAQLQPGDCLALYTDGLADVLDSFGHFSGLDQLKRLMQAQSGLDADSLCKAVFRGLGNYRGPAEQFDDMTLLVLRVS